MKESEKGYFKELAGMFDLQFFADGDHPITTTQSNAPGNDVSPTMKEYYDTELLENTRPELYFEQFGKKTNLPKNGGTTVEWRGFAPFKPALKPLVEGVTPNGNKLSMRKIKADLNQYGDYTEVSDKLELHAVDDVILGLTEEHGVQGGETLDLVVRNELMTGTNVMYAKGEDGAYAQGRHKITEKNVLNTVMVHKAATALKTMHTPMIDGSYIGIIHPHVSEDFRLSEGFIDIQKYAHAEKIFEGEIGKIAGVRFVETTHAKVYCGEDLAEDARNLEVKGAVSAAQNYVTFSGGTVAENALEGRLVLIGGELYKVLSNTADKMYLADDVTGEETTVSSVADKTPIYPGEGGAKGGAVYACAFFGKDAYGVVDPEDAGMEMIIKDRKTAGGPLNQRSTVGWKAESTAKILNEERFLRMEVGSDYSYTNYEGN